MTPARSSFDEFLLRCAEDCINVPRDLIQDFLTREDPDSAAVEASSAPLTASPALPSDAPTEQEYIAAWQESIMPDYDEYDGSCSCGNEKCAGPC